MHTINPLPAADNGKKLRLILDLRYINKHLRVQKFKYEDLRTFNSLQYCVISCSVPAKERRLKGFADNGKKLRLILDLRYINKHLRVQKFKYEDLRTFNSLQYCVISCSVPDREDT